MTALPPTDSRRVHGVTAASYPLNRTCAHPECTELAQDPHHCFPRSQVGNDSWFVTIEEDGRVSDPFPHVVGLCRNHHDLVENHHAWIKLVPDLDFDRMFVWHDRDGEEWDRLGPLNPQPGSREGRPKRRRYKGEQRRQRATITVRVPQDAAEDGAGILDDLHQQVEERLGYNPPRPPYYSIVDSYAYLLQTYTGE